MPPRRSIRDEDWERLRPIIRKHYLEEDQNLKDVLLILGAFHSFYPSKAQLEWKLKQWHLTKNMGAMDWKYVGNEIHRRKCRGKESKVYLSGIPLRTKAIERGISRHCYETAIEKAMRHVPEPLMPQDQPLLVCTPAPEEMNWPCGVVNIPWLLSRKFIDGLSIKVQSDMIITYDSRVCSSEGLVESILFSRYDLQLESYTTILGETFKTLRSIMPEEHEGAHATRAQCLLQRSNTINAEVLVFLIFVLSNNLFRNQNDLEQQERNTAATHLLLRLFRESGSDVLAKGLYESLPLSLQSSLDGLFREAIKASDLGAVELLLQAGVDVNTSFSDTGRFSYSCGTALQHVAILNQAGLLRMLIEHGADTQKIDIGTLTTAWLHRKTAGGSPEKTMRILLSYYRFRPEDEIQAVRLLWWISYTAATPATEAIIEYFRFNFCKSSSAAKTQLLIAAIRTNSRLVYELIAELGHCFNSCGYYPETPMTAAVYKGDIRLCERLLHLGATLEPGHEAPTPLQWAASFSDVGMVQKLLYWGADINFCHPRPALLRVPFEDATSMRLSYPTNLVREYEEERRDSIGSLGRTALQAALLGGKTTTAVFLLAAGAEVVGGELVMAIWNHQFGIIDGLLERGASFLDECTIFGADTVMEAAILSGKANLVHRLIAAHKRSVTGQALCASVYLSKATGDFTILNHLLTYKSQLLASQDTWIGTAMCLAAALGCMEIPKKMLSYGFHPKTSWYFGPPISRLRDALARSQQSISDTSIIRGYLSWRRKLRTCSEDHRPSPSRPIIEVAVCLDHLDFLKLLSGYGYQPGPTNPLDIGFTHILSIDTLRFLHSIGVRMTERVLAYAIFREAFSKKGRKKRRETIQWLLSVGVDINERSEDAQSLAGYFPGYWVLWTPLQSAAWRGDVDLIQQLIDHGAEVNESPYPESSYIPLQLAAMLGFFGAVQRLLELGADPNAPGNGSRYGRTAVETAARYGRLDIVQLLLNYGAQTSGCGRRQFVRSVAFAEREGHHAIVRLLKSHAGWTEADEDLLRQKDVALNDTSEKEDVPVYVRRYYGDESGGEGPAVDASSKEDQPLDEVESGSKEHASTSEDVSQALAEENVSRDVDRSETWLASDDTCCRVQELAEELDQPSETLLSTFDPNSNLPDAYEALSEEVGVEFLPSSMSYQIREELEGSGCLEESGDDLWTEEYSRFITELV